MLKCIIIIICFLNSFAQIYSQLNEQGSDFFIYTENELCSKYIFRGIVLEDNFVFQPSVYGGYDLPGKFGSISCGIWFNFSMPHEVLLVNEELNVQEKNHYTFKYNETDLYLIHEISLNKLNLKNTIAIYLFSPVTGYPNTTEYILNLNYPTGNFRLFSEFACDISAYPGAYVFTHGIGWEKDITNELYFESSLNIIWAGANYNSVNADIDKTLLNSIGTETSLTYSFKGGFYSKLKYQYNKMLGEEIIKNHGYDSWYIGLLAGITF